MNKLPRIIVGLVISVGFFVASMSDTLATEGDILLSDNFNDGNFNGWTIESGQWWINNGNLVGAKSGQAFGGRINTGSSEWDNYRIDLDINGFQGIDGGVGFRYNPNGNSYQLDLKFSPGPEYPPEAVFKKIQDGKTTILGSTHSMTLKGNIWYHLKIEAGNDHIKIWMQNNLIFDITDTATKVKKGTIAFNYWTGSIGVAYMRFDNVKITALAPSSPPRLPVIFIPGIGGSEMKATQDIVWSKDNGHGGTYSHAYGGNEKIWVNQNEAVSLGNDDYFDVLRLKTDGVTPEADLSLTGDLTSYGYPDIDSFFTGMGYSKGTNFFVFPYDWRKDVRSNKDSLDALIESAKTATDQSQVNLVVHSMGGLVVRYYISDATKASKVNKLIELGVPHLGATSALRTLMYGNALEKNVFGFIPLGIPASEVKDLSQNTPSIFQLLPSKSFFEFYDTFPFRDDRDIDNNSVTGSLNFIQTKILLSNLDYNMSVFDFGEQFHNNLDPVLNQTNGTKIYEINGTSQPTLGQIHETWWITWPINLFNKTDEIFINGDGTVPLYSSSLKNASKDISGATKIYYVEQKHSDLVASNGTAMQTVKSILNDDNSLPVEVKDVKIVLEGEQISLDDGELDLYDDQNRHCGLNSNGEIEENIPDVTCTTSGNTKHAFVKKKAAKVKVTTTRKDPAVNSKTTNLKIRTYKEDTISKTTIYKDIAIPQAGKIEFNLDPSAATPPILNFYPDSSNETNIPINPTSEVSGSAATDQIPPVSSTTISGVQSSGSIYTGPITVTLTGSDSDSGILRIEYSLDNGQTVQTYTEPFTVSNSGETIIQVKSIDNTGNEEVPQSTTIKIAAPPAPTTNTSEEESSVGTKPLSEVNIVANSSVATPGGPAHSADGSLNDSQEGPNSGTPDILGVEFDQSGVSKPVETSKKIIPDKQSFPAEKNLPKEFLSGLLTVSGGIITLAFFGLLTTFIKKVPGKM